MANPSRRHGRPFVLWPRRRPGGHCVFTSVHSVRSVFAWLATPSTSCRRARLAGGFLMFGWIPPLQSCNTDSASCQFPPTPSMRHLQRLVGHGSLNNANLHLSHKGLVQGMQPGSGAAVGLVVGCEVGYAVSSSSMDMSPSSGRRSSGLKLAALLAVQGRFFGPGMALLSSSSRY